LGITLRVATFRGSPIPDRSCRLITTSHRWCKSISKWKNNFKNQKF